MLVEDDYDYEELWEFWVPDGGERYKMELDDVATLNDGMGEQNLL